MTIRDHIRNWLGLDDIRHYVHDLDRVTREMNLRIANLQTSVGVHQRLVARVLVKVDPNYARPEDDPTRKAESDRLAEQVINKMLAEHKAQQRYRP